MQQLYQILKVSQSWYYQRPKAVAHKANLEKLASETRAVLATKAELRVTHSLGRAGRKAAASAIRFKALVKAYFDSLMVKGKPYKVACPYDRSYLNLNPHSKPSCAFSVLDHLKFAAVGRVVAVGFPAIVILS